MVLDGNSIINRAYYGVRPLTTRDGFFTHAIFGFLTMLGRLLDEEKPEALCVAFDRREPTFRHLEYEGYKATRHAMPEELAMQMPVLKDVLDAMNIPRYELAGFEADDLIGTISRKCESAGWDCVVATGDKDSLQLVTEHTTVKLISTRMGQTTTKDMTPESFREVYGFAPIHIVDLKALMGDASDNIPGVPGVGEKTAMALIQKYQSIDEIYRLLPDIEAKPNVIKKLTEGEESARQSFHLATIVTDAPLEFSPQDNLRKAPSDALYPLFMKLEFTKLIDKYGLKPPADIPAAEEPVDLTVTAEAVTTVEKAKEYLSLFRKAEHVTLLALPDLSGVIVDFVAGESTAVSAEFYFSRYEGDWNALLRALFSDDIKKVSHNVKDLQRTLLENGLPIEGFIFDTALAGYLLDATAGKYDIASLFAAYFHQTLSEPKLFDIAGNGCLGHVEATSAQIAQELLLRVDILCFDELQNFGVASCFHAFCLPSCLLISALHKFAVYNIVKIAFVGLNKFGVIGRATDGNRVRLMNAYGCATVYGEIHLAGIIAVRADRDGLICAEQRAAVKERMRADGREDYAFRFRVYHRAARRERVCRGTRRCSQNEAVRAEFIKLGTVDGKAEIVNSGLCTGDDRVV